VEECVVPMITPMQQPRDIAPTQRLIFIGGAEGSGTTMLRRLLSGPDVCASYSENFSKLPGHPDARPLLKAFVDGTKRLWDRSGSRSEHQQAFGDLQQSVTKIAISPAFSAQTCIVVKRSFPFGGPRYQYVPDLWDMLDVMPDTRIVVIFRNACAATYSALRRGFDTDIRRLAISCCTQLTWLAGQVDAIGFDKVHVVSYSTLCASPDAALAPLAGFCGLPLDALRQAAREEGLLRDADDRYRSELEAADLEWLESFFDERRCRQWSILADRAS
jgi:hypothetical protein